MLTAPSGAAPMVSSHFSAPSEGFVLADFILTTGADRSFNRSTGVFDGPVLFRHGEPTING
jgi:hypothetical protein